MTKKRTAAIVILSPIILCMGIVLLFIACIGYVLNGKWEFRAMLKDLSLLE